MKDLAKLTGRFLKILLVSFLLLFLLNVALFALCMGTYAKQESPWRVAQETAEGIVQVEGTFELPADLQEKLAQQDIWAALVDDDTLQVLWKTANTPGSVPATFTAAEIAGLNVGYIDGQPTFAAGGPYGLAVIGYPRETFWKLAHPSWHYRFIQNVPVYGFCGLLLNAAAILAIYLIANKKLLSVIGPIAQSIQKLPGPDPVRAPEHGLLSGLAHSVNEAGMVLQRQRDALQKKETARANWIAGVSHDIRTPLSMVMGYACQMEENMALDADTRQKAMVIRRQGEKMRNLVSDLNLASKLEYNMQPLSRAPVNLVALVRQIVADFLNLDIDGKHPIEFSAEEGLSACMVQGDRELLQRAVGNLLQNSVTHNEQGCRIRVSVRREQECCRICVEDDGVGVSEETLETIRKIPHYMTDSSGQRHGLGLLLVLQIAGAHQGTLAIGHGRDGGFRAEIILPLARDG